MSAPKEESVEGATQLNTSPQPEPATAAQLQAAQTEIEVRMSGFERSMVRLTRAGVIIAAFTGLIFLGQLYEMYDSGKQTSALVDAARKQADAADSFSKSAATVGKSVAGAQSDLQTMAHSSEDSLLAARNSLEVEQRAWLTIQSIRLASLAPNNPAIVEVEVLDTGRTISRSGYDTAFIYLPTEYLKSFAPVRSIEPKRLPPMFPNSPNFIPILTDSPMSDEEVRQVKEGTRFLFVWGDLTYKDVFDRAHHTNFCGVYVPKSNRFEICRQYPYDAN